MQKRSLGDAGPMVTEIGFGAWAIGGKDWGQVDDETSIAALHAALDAGVNLVDTADFYGFGHSERVVAKALKGHGEGVVIATKGGLRWDDDGQNIRRDSSPQYLRQAVEASLRRLEVDVIDLYQIHWPDESLPIADAVGALQRMREAGKIRHIGVSNFSVQQIEEAQSTGPLISLQMPLSLIDRGAEAALLPHCVRNGLGTLAYSPLGMGILTGKYMAEQVFDEGDVRGWFPHFRGETFRHHLETVERLKAVAQGEGKTLAQVAIRWVLSRPGVSIALVGAKRVEQVMENVGAAGWQLSERALEHIEGALEGIWPN